MRESGLNLDLRVESTEEAARLMSTQWQLGLSSGIAFCNPPPESSALDRVQTESLIKAALIAANSEGIQGKAVTPYLLSYLSKASDGATLKANMDLLVSNAKLAAQIAVAHSALRGRP